MSAHPLCPRTKPPVRFPRLGRTSIRRHRRLRPRVAELEHRTVLSSVQIPVPTPIHGPAGVTVPVFDYPVGPVHGTAQASSLASNFPTGPCYPNSPIRGPEQASSLASNFPTGPC
jgi:hypothetical protein